MRFCTTTCSRCMGHGTATRKKTIGNAKWRSQGKPPIKKRHLKVNAITTSVNAQLIKRQSGFASATSRSGKNRNAQMTAAAAGKSRHGSFRGGGAGAGRCGQRRESSYSARKGSLQPYAYRGLSDHSALS